MIDWQPLILTLYLSITTTIILLIIGVPLAFWLNHIRSGYKAILDAIISLPLVLPPTVIGFYFLLLFSPQRGIGRWLHDHFDVQLVFTFGGLVVASVIYSLPFMVQPIQSGLANLTPSLREASYVLGKGKWETLWYVELPNIKSSLLTGIVLSFAHTIGEFGVVLMIGGNIPGVTRVASIAIYDEVEAMNYHAANQYSLILLTLSFVILTCIYMITGRQGARRRY